MFCPNCGKENQLANSYCRQCGEFLPDFDKIKKREITPQEHLKANLVLTLMTALASITLAILLYAFFLGREDTPPIIYLTAGFLTAMFFWQAQVFWRNLQLRKQIPKREPLNENSEPKNLPVQNLNDKLLNQGDFRNVVPASVTEFTTKNLKEKTRKSP